MSIQSLEREFLDFCTTISPSEMRKNPKLKFEIDKILEMILAEKHRTPHAENDDSIQLIRIYLARVVQGTTENLRVNRDSENKLLE